MPATDFDFKEKYRYQNGFNSYFETEAVPNALPIGHNSPQRPAHGLYAEKLSGTAFTAPRGENKQTWLYRILPSCAHTPFETVSWPAGDGHGTGPQSGSVDLGESAATKTTKTTKMHYLPNQLRWDAFDHGSASTDFVGGLHLIAGAGDPTMKTGLGVYIFAAGRSMDATSSFYSADGDFLLVAQEGVLDIRTELGWLLVRPMEVAVVPRGVKFAVYLPQGRARGYALELYQGHFALPELGAIGSNGLANERDFQAPVASFDDDKDFGRVAAAAAAPTHDYLVTAKFAQGLYQMRQTHTPFDVVAWHGNYCPYKYDLGRFNSLGTVSFDHPDPSIFTVLTAASDRAGTAVADFVIFPPRWLVGEDTFRPPWYHRNTMSEFMGLIQGDYDAKKPGPGGFVPGGASLHNVMTAHGPDADTHEQARAVARLAPAKVGAASCAFMFETCLMLAVSDWGLHTCGKLQHQYCQHSWGPLKVHWTRPDDDAYAADAHLLEGGTREHGHGHDMT